MKWSEYERNMKGTSENLANAIVAGSLHMSKPPLAYVCPLVAELITHTGHYTVRFRLRLDRRLDRRLDHAAFS